MSIKQNQSRFLQTAHLWDKEYEKTEYSPVYEPLWHMLQSLLESVSVKTVLDFGCGDGAYAYLIAEKGFRVTGIDISDKAVQKATVRKCSRCEFIRHECIPHDLPSVFFDVVLMLNSIHCLPLVQRLVLYEQVRRVLRPSGYFFASVLSLEDESYPRQEWQEINAGTFIDETGRLFHFFSESELVNELSWLEIKEIRKLQSIHPACGRKSALFVVTAQFSGQKNH